MQLLHCQFLTRHPAHPKITKTKPNPNPTTLYTLTKQEARAAAACGVAGDPFVDCSGGKCYFGKDMAGLFFGTVLLIVPFCYVGTSTVCPPTPPHHTL